MILCAKQEFDQMMLDRLDSSEFINFSERR